VKRVELVLKSESWMESDEHKDSNCDHTMTIVSMDDEISRGDEEAYQDSRMMKVVSSLINLLFHPPPSSMTLYTHLVKIVMNDTITAHRNPRKRVLERSLLYAGFFQEGYRWTRTANSPQARQNSSKETIWKIRPASMR
jgi:hypothetical protein